MFGGRRSPQKGWRVPLYQWSKEHPLSVTATGPVTGARGLDKAATLYSAATWAPFSTTERRMRRTSRARETPRMAKMKKQSK